MSCPDDVSLPGIPTKWLPPHGSLYTPPRCVRHDADCRAVVMQRGRKGEGLHDEGGHPRSQDPRSISCSHTPMDMVELYALVLCYFLNKTLYIFIITV